MSASHTPEPWKVSNECEWVVDHDRYSSYSWAEIEACGETVALSVTHRSDDLMEANARRIVACVNACAPIETSELEWITRTGGLLGPRDDIARLAAHRDELLQALRLVGLLRQLGGMLPDTHEIVQMVVEAADAAISKVEAAK